MSKKRRVLLLYGGWEGHTPELFADYAESELLQGFEVVRSQDLGMLEINTLRKFDLFVPIWTFDSITEQQENDLLEAVASGMGMVAWHGNTSAFLGNRPHKMMLGGKFVAHPGGDSIKYNVHFESDEPLVEKLNDFSIVSEQYYLLVDPAVNVLATTLIDGGEFPWLKGVKMPVAWKRMWGEGKVFYCAIGHTLKDFEIPTVKTLLKRAVMWASERNIPSDN